MNFVTKYLKNSPCRNVLYGHILLQSHTSGGQWDKENLQNIMLYIMRRSKRTGQLLCGPKSSFQLKVNFAFYFEIKVLEYGGRLHSLWSSRLTIMSSLGVGPLCLSNPKSMSLSSRRFYSTACYWQAFCRGWFPFPAELNTCSMCQN